MHCGNPAEVDARTGITIWLIKLWVIPEIEHVCTQIKSCGLPRYFQRLLQGEAPIVEPRAVECRGTAVAKVSDVRHLKAARIEPQHSASANMARQLIVAAVASPVGEWVDKGTSGLIGRRQHNGLAGRQGRDGR